MGVAERRGRDRAERERRIVSAARAIAASEGWGAVTVRRLADEIEYSQPVLYSHFRNRDAILSAVAVEGFQELATALGEAAASPGDRRALLRKLATAYLDFTFAHPALYEVMFTMNTGLRFAQADTRPELRAAFAALRAVVATRGDDDEIATETFWAALHGLTELERSGRIRSAARTARVEFIVERFSSMAGSG